MSTDQTVDTAVDLGLEAGIEGAAAVAHEELRGHQWLWIMRRAVSITRTKIGLVIVGLMLAVALFGPLVAPHSPTEFVAVTVKVYDWVRVRPVKVQVRFAVPTQPAGAPTAGSEVTV